MPRIPQWRANKRAIRESPLRGGAKAPPYGVCANNAHHVCIHFAFPMRVLSLCENGAQGEGLREGANNVHHVSTYALGKPFLPTASADTSVS